MFLQTRKMQFWQPRRERFSKKVKLFVPKVQKKIKKHGFWEKNFLLKKFIRNCSTQFFKSRRKNFKKMAAISSIIVVNSKNLMFPKQKRVFLKWYSGHIECSFAILSTTPKKLSQELERSLLNVRKKSDWKLSVFPKKIFSPEWSPGIVDCSFETFARKFPRKGQSFPLKLRYW